MQEQSNRRLSSYKFSSKSVEIQFSQRWKIADFKCLADLSSPGCGYKSVQFHHPYLKNIAWYMMIYPKGCAGDDGDTESDTETDDDDYFPALYLMMKNFTGAPASVQASFLVASIFDDDEETVIFHSSLSKYVDDDERRGGTPRTSVEIDREDGSLLLDCIVTAVIYVNQAGIDGILCSARKLSEPIPSSLCVLSNITSVSQEWHISDVGTCINNSEPGDKIDGEVFLHPSLESARWRMHFYPNGKWTNTYDNASLYLHLDSVPETQNTKVKAKFQFFAVFKDGIQREISGVLVRSFQSNDGAHDTDQSFGIQRFSVRDFQRKDGSLLLKCDVDICDPCVTSILAPSGSVVLASAEKGLDRGLRDRMTKMMETGYASDFIIKVGSTKFPVHRAMLGCCSDVFKAMLDSCLEEAKSSKIKISDFSPEAVRLMIHYIYVGNLPNEDVSCHVKELAGLADKYQLQDLKEFCEQKICDWLTPENVVDYIFLADTCNLSLVQDACVDVFLSLVRNRSSEVYAKLKEVHPRLAIDILEKVTEMCPPASKRL